MKCWRILSVWSLAPLNWPVRAARALSGWPPLTYVRGSDFILFPQRRLLTVQSYCQALGAPSRLDKLIQLQRDTAVTPLLKLRSEFIAARVQDHSLSYHHRVAGESRRFRFIDHQQIRNMGLQHFLPVRVKCSWKVDRAITR